MSIKPGATVVFTRDFVANPHAPKMMVVLTEESDGKVRISEGDKVLASISVDLLHLYPEELGSAVIRALAVAVRLTASDARSRALREAASRSNGN